MGFHDGASRLLGWGIAIVIRGYQLLIAPILAGEALRSRRDYRSAVGERLALVKVTREQEAQRRAALEQRARQGRGEFHGQVMDLELV